MSGRGIRIAGGTWRGRRLAVPAKGVRPTEGRVREALFSIWQHQVVGGSFLDLFAGSGAVGVEALSRGAKSVTAIEGSAPLARALRDTVAGESTFQVIRARLPEALERLPAQRFDLIFADPPYRFLAYDRLLDLTEHWLVSDGELALEHASEAEPTAEISPPAGLVLADRRQYGTTHISFFRRLPTNLSAGSG